MHSLDLAWVAQWDGKFDEKDREIKVTIDKLKTSAVDAINPVGKACALKLQPCSLLQDFEGDAGDHLLSCDVGPSTTANNHAVEASASKHALPESVFKSDLVTPLPESTVVKI